MIEKEEEKYNYVAKYCSSMPKDLEIAKSLAQLDSLPPSKQHEMASWEWKEI
ncbi:TPA: hypothetical protein ACSYUX_14445 [Listeria monocytogenes]